MTNHNDAAFPRENLSYGMTKREYFAAMAMQGIISSPQFAVAEIATDAVKLADELIAALNKEPNGTEPK